MNNYDILMENRKKIVEKLIKNMENGDLIFKKGWDINLVKPVNPVSEVSYKGGNRINLMNVAIEKNYKDPRWLTFNQAKSKGWNVKKGEKGVMCEKWIFDKIVKEIDPKTNEKIEVRKPLEKPIPSYFIVFNAEQINGIPEYKRQVLNESEKIKIANDFIKSSECPIREVAQDQAFYSPTEDEIILPLRSAFKSEEAFLRTTLHEMGHSTGHPDRLNRNLANKFGSPEYAKEELVAELTSVFTQAKLGLKLEGEHFNNHTSYLKSWIKVLKEDPNELFKAASQAEKATERLYENYLVLKKEEQQKIYIQERENEKRNIQKEKQFFKELAITLYYCEKNLGIPEKTILKGEKAYEALKTIVNTDIKEQGKQYKISLEFQYKNYNTGEMKLYLGNSEFSGKEKVSQALEHRLKLFPLNLIKDKENVAKIQKTTPEEITKSSNEILEEITKIMRSFKRQEKLYNEKILDEMNISKSWAKKLEQDKNLELVR